jgi:chromate reductase, NAD(P)H dehydrogenase (quinone)
MARIVGIAGSVRTGSFNAALLRAAAAVSPAGTVVDIESIAGIPLYNGDLEEQHGIPEAAARLKESIASADGLLLVTPEYNNSLPGVFKNAIDWLSRPPKDIRRVFGDKPVALMGATPGQGGTRFAQVAWLPVLRTLGTRAWSGKQLYVAGAGQVFDAAGEIVDASVRQRLTEFMAGFAAFVQAR